MMVSLRHVLIIVSFQLVLGFQSTFNLLKVKGSKSQSHLKLKSEDNDGQYSYDDSRSSSKLKFQTLSQVSQRKYDYISLKKFQERCNRISNKESSFLLSFWSNTLNCFQIFPNFSSNTRVSITTTCITLQTILLNPNHWSKIVKWDHPGGKADNQINIKDIVQALYDAKWTSDAFQTPALIYTLSKLKVVDIKDEKYVQAINVLLEQRARLSLHRNQPYSSYLRYLNAKALLSLLENDFIPDRVFDTQFLNPDTPRTTEDKICYALERGNMVAFDELSRQLAFYSSGDSAQFDVIVLAYSLLTYYITSQNVYLQSYAKGVIQNTNTKLIKSALKILFDSQMLDGTWRKGEPIFSLNDYSSSGTSTKRDIGNSYVFFLDMVSDIVSVLTPLQSTLLEPYVANLERCVSWVEGNILEEMLPEECDPIKKKCFGLTVRGWRSNHLGSGGAVGWCTANVFAVLTNIRTLLQDLITANVLSEFNGKLADTSSSSNAKPSRTTNGNGNGNSNTLPLNSHRNDWVSLMDADLKFASGETTTLKQVLFAKLIQPQVVKDENLLHSFTPSVAAGSSSSASMSTGDSGGSGSSSGSGAAPSYSCILFGPPGTAKTTICTSLANYLQWNFVTIDTACFLADGLQNVASRMTYIFDRLKGLDRTIVLFDEVEEFCLDRENPNLAMESRLLTTAMLTQLNDLRRQQSVIFIVATNRLRSFDAAVTRPGRFDMLLFVGTPSADARLKRLNNKLRTIINAESSPPYTVKEQMEIIQKTVTEFMHTHWDAYLRFFTFAENEMFINAICETISQNNFKSRSSSSVSQSSAVVNASGPTSSISEQELHQIMLNIETVSTIKGPVRDEYCASEMLSRV